MAEEIVKRDISRDIGDEEEEEFETHHYLVFTVRNQEFGIQALRVREISALMEVTKVPNAPAFIEGIMNLRGQLVSVINFRRKFRFEEKENDEDTRIIVAEHSGFPIGIVVDNVEEVMKIPIEKMQQLPESTDELISEKQIVGVGMLEGRLIILLDVDRLLSKEEISEVIDLSNVVDRVAEKKPGEKKTE